MLRMFRFMTKHTLLGLGRVFLLWMHASGRFGTFLCLVNVARFRFSAVFGIVPHRAPPRRRGKVLEKLVRGYGIA